MKKPPTRKERFADPVSFAEEVLGLELWDLQEQILRSIVSERRVAVKSCHSSGKTFTAAIASLYWAAKYRDGRVIVTAPGWNQVKNVLWAQLHQFLRGSKFKFPAVANQTELRFGPGNMILGLSTDESNRFQGHHAGHLLIVVDEAVGVAAPIWEAIEGALASGDAHLLCLGNPTVASGPFYDAFTRSRAAWTTFTISAFDTPNLAGIPDIDALLALPDDALDQNLSPWLIQRRWVRERYDAWWNGSIETSPLWASRVLGDWPSQSSNALIGLAWLEAARQSAGDTGGPITVGVDVAGPGEDSSAACVACDGVALETESWHMPDPRGPIVAMLNKYRPRLKRVRVDSAGIGYGLCLHLQDLGFPVEQVNVGSASSAPERYTNLKAELFWDLRDRFKAGQIRGLDDASVGQLGTLNYELSPKGQIAIESKQDMRRRGVKSPDRGDAVMLAFATANNDGWRFIDRFFSDEAMAKWRTPAAPADKQISALWQGYNTAPQERPTMKCHYCPRPIAEGETYSNVPGGAMLGESWYAHSGCAQGALAGEFNH